jgi:Ca-activated chloride channel family protein
MRDRSVAAVKHMIDLSLFHFMRPLWLLGLIGVAVLIFFAWRATNRQSNTHTLVAPHLRDALLIGEVERHRRSPFQAAALVLTLLILAAAGPTWQQQPSPWFAETVPLVVAMEVTDSMRSNDVQPSRLDRARFKVLDLIEARTGSRTAIIAYAGSSHIVVPPTQDINVLKPLMDSLDPAIMPVAGTSAASALSVARGLIGPDATSGSILFVTDGFEREDVAVFDALRDQLPSLSVVAYVLGTSAGGAALMPDGSLARGPDGQLVDTAVDEDVLDRISGTGVRIIRARADGADVGSLIRVIESRLRQAVDADAQWRDDAWWLMWPAGLAVLFWFRRGWSLR